jgi:acetyltransferase-like isoleucine patch superfamily enzyme
VSGANGLANVNATSTNYVGYFWSEVPGFSKFGSYTGNNISDGPFVYLGFRPKFIMIKNITLGKSKT